MLSLLAGFQHVDLSRDQTSRLVSFSVPMRSAREGLATLRSCVLMAISIRASIMPFKFDIYIGWLSSWPRSMVG